MTDNPLVNLGASSTPGERWAALRAFVEAWWRVTLPAAHGSWLEQLRAIDRQVGVFRQNELCDEVIAGRTAFLVENQGVCHWATQGDGPDPTVWYRENDHRAAWEREESTLSWFLLQAVIVEACFVGNETGGQIDSRFVQIGPGWRWAGIRVYAAPDAVARATTDAMRRSWHMIAS